MSTLLKDLPCDGSLYSNIPNSRLPVELESNKQLNPFEKYAVFLLPNEEQFGSTVFHSFFLTFIFNPASSVTSAKRQHKKPKNQYVNVSDAYMPLSILVMAYLNGSYLFSSDKTAALQCAITDQAIRSASKKKSLSKRKKSILHKLGIGVFTSSSTGRERSFILDTSLHISRKATFESIIETYPNQNFATEKERIQYLKSVLIPDKI